MHLRVSVPLGLFLSWAGATFALLAAVPRADADVPPPVDSPYAGTLELHVDARNVAQKIFAAHERIPVEPGALTLLYPQWHLGTHAPSGALLAQLAGLELTGNGKRLEWSRDPVNMYAFHVDVPAGVTTLEADFQFLSPIEHDQGAILATPVMLAVHWEALLLYPAGFYAHGILVRPSLTLPAQWQFAGALEVAARDGDTVQFQPLDIEELVDSPIFAGQFFQRVDLDPGAKVPVHLDMVADAPEHLSASPAQLEAHRRLVQQAYKLFGSHHFAHYDFLMALSDEFTFAGLEHHQSSENGVRTTYFSDWDHQQSWRSALVSHEFIHSWDGKFRRPADQLTANFNLPMQDSLLWVYEGGTSYWGHVLGARSGLVETGQMREALAATAALYEQQRAGRVWRSLQDTTNDPIINHRSPLAWVSWQRAEDYYSEGELIWFDADTKIRELSKDRRSLDDFARRFFGVEDGRHKPLTYTFDDVVHALNGVQAYDWADFLRSRLDGHGPGAPLDGLARSGWRLGYAEQPTPFFADAETYRKVFDFSYSLGCTLDKSGRIANVVWNGPAFRAGLTQGYTLLAVDGHSYTPERLSAAITAAKGGAQPIELLLQQADRYETKRIEYHDGLRYPRLERIPGTPDRLAEIFKPRA